MAAREGQVQKSISDHFVYVSPWHFGCLHQVEMLDLISCHPRVDPNLLDRAGRIIKIQDDDQDDDDFNDQDQDDDNNYFDDHVDDWMTTPRKNSSPPCGLPWQPLLSCPAPQHGGSPGQPTQLKTYQSPFKFNPIHNSCLNQIQFNLIQSNSLQPIPSQPVHRCPQKKPPM